MGRTVHAVRVREAVASVSNSSSNVLTSTSSRDFSSYKRDFHTFQERELEEKSSFQFDTTFTSTISALHPKLDFLKLLFPGFPQRMAIYPSFSLVKHTPQ